MLICIGIVAPTYQCFWGAELLVYCLVGYSNLWSVLLLTTTQTEPAVYNSSDSQQGPLPYQGVDQQKYLQMRVSKSGLNTTYQPESPQNHNSFCLP
jgi:hypothetical protein